MLITLGHNRSLLKLLIIKPHFPLPKNTRLACAGAARLNLPAVLETLRSHCALTWHRVGIVFTLLFFRCFSVVLSVITCVAFFGFRVLLFVSWVLLFVSRVLLFSWMLLFCFPYWFLAVVSAFLTPVHLLSNRSVGHGQLAVLVLDRFNCRTDEKSWP